MRTLSGNSWSSQSGSFRRSTPTTPPSLSIHFPTPPSPFPRDQRGDSLPDSKSSLNTSLLLAVSLLSGAGPDDAAAPVLAPATSAPPFLSHAHNCIAISAQSTRINGPRGFFVTLGIAFDAFTENILAL